MSDAIPVFTSGGIGDQIIALPLLYELFRDSPVPVKLYTNYPEIMRLFNLPETIRIVDNQKERRSDHYMVNINDFVDFKFNRVIGDPRELLPESLRPVYDARQKIQPVWGELIMAEPHRANDMGKLAVAHGLTRWKLPFHCVGREWKPYAWTTHGVVRQLFITVHDGFDKHLTYLESMKSIAMDCWARFVSSFKRQHPDIAVVQLGGVKHRKIPGVDVDLAGKISFSESMNYLKSSLVHVDGDSGLVHARRLLGGPSVVVFGPTPADYFGYPENANLKPSYCQPCWWTKRDWMQHCVKGYSGPRCMYSTHPDMILAAVNKVL